MSRFSLDVEANAVGSFRLNLDGSYEYDQQ
jgi:hypothetical protein